MTISEIFKRAIVRRVVFVVVALVLGWIGINPNAKAQDYTACFSNVRVGSVPGAICPTRQDAYEQAIAGCEAASGAACQVFDSRNTPNGLYGFYGAQVGSSSFYLNYRSYSLTNECPSGTSWNDTAKMCLCPSGMVLTGGSCKDCSALNNEAGSPALAGSISRPFSERCIGSGSNSCLLAYQPGSGGCTSALGQTICNGTFAYTGASCSRPSDDPEPPEPIDPKDENPEECVSAGQNQTFCIRQNGDHCHSTSSGKQICWKPGETGEKGEGNEYQIRDPGSNPPTPPANKDPLVPSGDPVTTTTTTGTGTTIVTTTQNYTTTNGTNSPNQGSPGTPSGDKDGSDEGDDKGDENGSTGGGDCASPPVNSGDALLSQIATQTWQTRCAVSERDRLQDEQAGQLAQEPDALGTVDESGIFADGADITQSLSESLLGSGGGQCATGWSLLGNPIELPDGFWSLASWIGSLLVALAYIWAAVLISEN